MRFDRLFTYDLLEDGRIDDITNNNIFLLYFMEHIDILVTVRLFSNRSQKASKCAKNVSGTLAGASCETFRTYYILTMSVVFYRTADDEFCLFSSLTEKTFFL